jgi:hypothetical protein
MAGEGLHHRVQPPRGKRAGTPYVLITDEVHNALQRVAAKRRRLSAYWSFDAWSRRRVATVQLQLPFDVDVDVQAAA